MMAVCDACGVELCLNVAKQGLFGFFVVGAIANHALDAELLGLGNVSGGKLRGDIEVIGKLVDAHDMSFVVGLINGVIDIVANRLGGWHCLWKAAPFQLRRLEPLIGCVVKHLGGSSVGLGCH